MLIAYTVRCKEKFAKLPANTSFSFAKVHEAKALWFQLFRKAFLNCFAKLPEAGKLFNLAYGSHIHVCAMRSIPEANPKTLQTLLCNVLYTIGITRSYKN